MTDIQWAVFPLEIYVEERHSCVLGLERERERAGKFRLAYGNKKLITIK